MGFWRFGRGNRETGLEIGGVHLGERPWLVLGGGGLKGLAHLGVWRALQERGFVPEGILGTSIGALVGANIAAGRPLKEMEVEARSLERGDIARLQRRALWLNGIRASSLYHGEPLRDYLAKVLPRGGWKSLVTRFQTNAVELGTGRMEWFGIGARTDVSLLDAVYASTALPVFYPPVRLVGGVYLDGGVADALPITRAAELGATGIVAVDVGAGERVDSEKVVGGGMIAVHERVFSLMAGRRRREGVAGWEGPPLLYIRPKLDGYGGFDFERVGEFLELGRVAGLEAVGEAGRESPAGAS
ncbi:MAG: patatin-like phospholipase family protein [Gemmatimonadota bacterium]